MIPALISLPANRVWRTYHGGRTLDQINGKASPQDSHFAEDWIASTTRAVNKGREDQTQEGYSKVLIKGQEHYLNDLMHAYPLELLGEGHYQKYGANAQVLVKFLDSAIRLHIQAHPTIAFSQKYLNSNSGKTEAYVILGTRQEVSEPYIYLGFQHPLSREELKQAIVQQQTEKILSCFEKIYIKPGDVFIVPGGLPHAIGEGVFMIEIMEPTDFVVRLEFERGGYVLPEPARFMGRDVEFALDMMEFQALPIEVIKEKYFSEPILVSQDNNHEEWILIGKKQTSCFSVRRLILKNQFTRQGHYFHIAIIIKGEGTVVAENESLQVKTADKFIVPFKTKEITYTPSTTEMEVILTFPPEEKW